MTVHMEPLVKRLNAEAIAFSKRLQTQLALLGLSRSPTELGRAFYQACEGKGVTTHCARSWLIGNSIPKQSNLRVLAKLLQISPDQLRFGKTEANTVLFANQEVSIEDQEFLAKYFSLTPTQKSIVRSVANFPI